jgi:hypothetical protein
MKTTISILAVLIITVLLGFTFTPESSSASKADISGDCCISGFHDPGSIINAYYNGVYVTSVTTLSDGTFTICVGATQSPVTLTTSSFVKKGIDRCASGIRFYSQDN